MVFRIDTRGMNPSMPPCDPTGESGDAEPCGEGRLMALRFKDRRHAGSLLADELSRYQGEPSLLVLALPRGGVPVAFEIADRLGAELDVFTVRKLGVPRQPELAMGAIASGGIRVLNRSIVDALRISDQEIQAVTERERRELVRREEEYRGDRPDLDLEDRTVIIVDDGLATGATMEAAIEAVKTRNPRTLIVAVPTAPPDTARRLSTMVDEMVCVQTPEPFGGVGGWYQDFSQTTDREVIDYLERAAAPT